MSVPDWYRVDMGRCPCGIRLDPQSFRVRSAYLDAQITGLCQACQDRVYLAYDEEEGRRHPIVDGGLISVRAHASVEEVALMPFRLVVPGPGRAKLVWESPLLTRAGPELDSVDLVSDLNLMAGHLLNHQVRLSEYSAFDSLSPRLEDLSYLIGLDQPSLDAAASVCRFPDGIATAGLAESVPWVHLFGRPLRPVQSWTVQEPGPPSAVRILAVMGLLLMEHGRDRLRPLDHLVAGPSYGAVVESLHEHP